MNQITIQLSTEQYQYIQKIANQQKTSPEKILESKITEWLEESQTDFNQAANYVLTKNSELYKRLV
ncbi:DNA-binding protein [Hydrocoleum sp. CS-953]|uniref:DNA-binding protein n=1 Tax=Hydrocoleum sp. CS-953 TaxID=1671698 RepID=UPI000B9BDB30|nr:DNA-binding protein [Hydrocoleum sp. CS-953]OZH53481.1 DNA-binding protein [Hydrocoleum sp. CS-953]